MTLRAKTLLIIGLTLVGLLLALSLAASTILLRGFAEVEAREGHRNVERALQAVEASVLWYTEGKGDEDMGVHYFERRVPADVDDGDLRQWRRFRTPLPNSPLSYHGEIFSILWCVRVRAFLKRGKQSFYELPFRLGSIDSPRGRLQPE